MPQCEIQWLDTTTHQPTPDTNEAIGEVWLIAHQWIREDLTVYQVPESRRIPICADHAKHLVQLTYTYPLWSFQAYERPTE